MQTQPNLGEMETFSKEAGHIVSSVLPNYDNFGIMNVASYKSLQDEYIKTIEDRLFSHESDESIMDVFNKRMYLGALTDSANEHPDGNVSNAASFLGYSREHFSRESSRLGIDGRPYKLGNEKSDFKQFEKEILEDILLEKVIKYKLVVDYEELEEIRQQISVATEDITDRLNDLDIYQLYVNKMSFVYKMAEDILKDKYQEVKGQENAYKILQEEFKKRYVAALRSESFNDDQIAALIDKSPRTVARLKDRKKS